MKLKSAKTGTKTYNALIALHLVTLASGLISCKKYVGATRPASEGMPATPSNGPQLQAIVMERPGELYAFSARLSWPLPEGWLAQETQVKILRTDQQTQVTTVLTPPNATDSIYIDILLEQGRRYDYVLTFSHAKYADVTLHRSITTPVDLELHRNQRLDLATLESEAGQFNFHRIKLGPDSVLMTSLPNTTITAHEVISNHGSIAFFVPSEAATNGQSGLNAGSLTMNVDTLSGERLTLNSSGQNGGPAAWVEQPPGNLETQIITHGCPDCPANIPSVGTNIINGCAAYGPVPYSWDFDQIYAAALPFANQINWCHIGAQVLRAQHSRGYFRTKEGQYDRPFTQAGNAGHGGRIDLRYNSSTTEIIQNAERARPGTPLPEATTYSYSFDVINECPLDPTPDRPCLPGFLPPEVYHLQITPIRNRSMNHASYGTEGTVCLAAGQNAQTCTTQ